MELVEFKASPFSETTPTTLASELESELMIETINSDSNSITIIDSNNKEDDAFNCTTTDCVDDTNCHQQQQFSTAVNSLDASSYEGNNKDETRFRSEYNF